MDTEKIAKEWFRQAKYDYETALAMFESERYLYAIFMSHLAIEKGLKGIFVRDLKQSAPKSHDLIFLLSKITIDLKTEQKTFLEDINDLSVPTRYPTDLRKSLKQFTKKNTHHFLNNTKEFLQWLKIF